MNPVLLIAIPLLAAFVSVILKKIDKVILMLAALFNTALSIYIAVQYVAPTVYTIGGFKPPFGISLYLDNYAMVGIVLINLVFVLTVLLSNQSLGKYSTVVIISMAALNGMVLTGDLFNLFVFMEIGAIAAYILTTMNKGFKHTFNYLVLGTLASGLFLFGIAVIYNLFGSLNLADIKGMIDMQSYSIANVMVLPSVLLFAGLSVEAKLLPFSGWVRGVLKDSNSLVGTLIVSAYAAAILLVFGTFAKHGSYHDRRIKDRIQCYSDRDIGSRGICGIFKNEYPRSPIVFEYCSIRACRFTLPLRIEYSGCIGTFKQCGIQTRLIQHFGEDL